MSIATERIVNYLLVDDSNEHAAIIDRCLGHAGLPNRIDRVSSGAEALTYLEGEGSFADRESHPYPDVVLLDVRMPGVLNGLQTLQAIRADARHRSLVVFMLTTSDRDTDINRAYELGANGYIVKSGDTDEMVDKLRRLQESNSALVQLPRRERRPDSEHGYEDSSEQTAPNDVELLVQPDEDAAFASLISSYRNDRDEMLRLLTLLEQISPTRFARLAQRFCVEQRHLIADDQEVDWAFLRCAVMQLLPQHTAPETMAGILASLVPVIESDPSTDRHSTTWNYWRGFCAAYSNQNLCLSTAPTERDDFDSRPTSTAWKRVAVLGWIALVALVAYVIGNGGF